MRLSQWVGTDEKTAANGLETLRRVENLTEGRLKSIENKLLE